MRPTVGLLIALALLAPAAHASTPSAAEWESCSTIPSDPERLACYDRVAGRAASLPQPAAELPAAPAEPPEVLLSALSRHWELDDAAKRGAFLFRPHRPNYFLPAKYSNRPNSTPFQGNLIQPDLGLDNVEAELQLSFKIKAMEGVFGHDDLDLWFGYTATSFWQAYNQDISSPFRETNYEPEVMLVLRTDGELGGFRWRFLNLGLVHQSNGRSAALSRSWNRAYAQFGLERGNLAVLLRPWVRLPESDGVDDNPDIEDYLGHGDLQLVYRDGRNAYSLLLRNNFKSDNHGAFKLNWSFPLYGRLKGYVQYFNGYGESLIDYNHKQQSLGVGLSLTEGM